MVTADFGISAHPESVKIHERLDSSDIFFNLFEEELEAKDQDVREAFDVFDENKYEFIDEKDLQRVIVQTAELHNCKKMIMAFYENGDGRHSLSFLFINDDLVFLKFLRVRENKDLCQ
ncbi:hypothetical protein HAX54_021190 [Datura stramonium]|uniref:EF-hand domain-containing protein n=1 Tax=Datura stramonium TaxID=4076 RepID=A0ABS8UUG5_DATST|nr:hypothetical protein [Datura stramonium]